MMTRSVGARVILVNGALAGYLRRGERELLLLLPEAEPQRSQYAREVARMLLHLAVSRDEARRGMLLAEINGESAMAHPSSRVFLEEGFVATAMGLQARLKPAPMGLKVSARGTPLAAPIGGGNRMAEPHPTDNGLVDNPPSNETREGERVRSSNDRDQAGDRAGVPPRQSRGDDEAVRGRSVDDLEADVDPDSATSEIDRDDTAID